MICISLSLYEFISIILDMVLIFIMWATWRQSKKALKKAAQKAVKKAMEKAKEKSRSATKKPPNGKK